VNVIVGGRAEDYNITGKTDKAELTAFKQFRFFQMLVHSIILVIRSTLISIIIKITLPSTSALNPNNTNIKTRTLIILVIQTYNLLFFDNYEMKLSFDYAF
jgi:hypothetical protein